MKTKKYSFAILLPLCISCFGFKNELQSQNTWIQKATYGGTGRYTAVGFSIGTKGYIGTGSPDGGFAYVDFWEYDPVSDTWMQKANYGGGGRFDAVGFSIGTKGYVGTGTTNAGNALQDFWSWNQLTNTWSPVASLIGAGRRLGVGFSIGNKGYVSMGTNAGLNSFYNDLWEYDPTADTIGGLPWNQKASFPGAGRAGAICFTIGTKAYVGTGTTWSTTFSDFKEYNQVTDTWTAKANYAGGPIYAAVGFSINNRGYVATGFPGPSQDLREYDPATDVWNQRTNFGGVARVYPVAFTINGNGYVGTGFNPSTAYRDFWEYIPLDVSVEEQNAISEASIYPSVSDGHIFIKTKIRRSALRIYNMNGDLLFETNIESCSEDADLTFLSNGIYLARLNSMENESEFTTQKLIIAH
ncbi:MAG: galactose oxidase [Bacteroidetes bacterium]|nr:galactose oxidase [Bacteroidota bacterium]